MKKLLTSLQSRYMLLILTALVLFQFAYLLSAVVFTGLTNQEQSEQAPDYLKVEAEWHQAAKELIPTEFVPDQPGANNPALNESASNEAAPNESTFDKSVASYHNAVQQLYRDWGQRYPDAAMFWVDGAGELQSSWNVQHELPSIWSAAYTVQYMKLSYGNDPYTVIAFVGGTEQQGFVVIELPRHLFQPPIKKIYDQFGNLLFFAVFIIVLLFIVLSYLFFRSIRKRLLRLGQAMSIRDVDNLPVAIEVRRQDEIGQLEQSFNHMVLELKQSRAREQEDEQVRRQLIANLSHDIRTPLTKLRANAYTISKHELPEDITSAASSLEGSVRQIDELVDNLLAYTLLIGERYRMELQAVAMPRFLREHLAAWYAAFEQQGFAVEVKLEAMAGQSWSIDRIWMKRVLDNLLQNVLRHAHAGKYVAVETASCTGYDVIRIIDRGPGIDERQWQDSSLKQSDEHISEHSSGYPCQQATVQQQYDANSPIQHQRSAQQPKSQAALSTSHDNYAGSGIGLSIVDMMVKGMGLSWHMYRQEHCFVVEIRKPHVGIAPKKHSQTRKNADLNKI